MAYGLFQSGCPKIYLSKLKQDHAMPSAFFSIGDQRCLFLVKERDLDATSRLESDCTCT